MVDKINYLLFYGQIPVYDHESKLIANIRQFNRFYTMQLGLLQQHIFDSEFSLTEVRVLYEINFNQQTTATGIREALNIDAGYLSRLLRNFEKKGLIIKHPLPEDGRSNYLQLTARGKKIMATFNELSDGQISRMLEHLAPAQRSKIAHAMGTVRYLLKAPGSALTLADIHIRHGLQPGDVIRSVNGSWRITTGASVSCIAVGDFT